MIETAQAGSISLIGVDYVHFKTADGGDLYLTRFGLPFREQLTPSNWYEPNWFASHRTKLVGTSAIYRLPTKPVNGVSLNLVVRFSRVGQEVPLDPVTRNENINAEFNSPFEEFALVMELRRPAMNGVRPRIFTKKPLAIYAPAERLQGWQTGRLESKIAAKVARHPEAEIDMGRTYILLYGWIKGLNVMEALPFLGMSYDRAEAFASAMTLCALRELGQNGFRMVDIKPQHIILRIRSDGSLLQRRDGNPAYALVDYELLERRNPKSKW